MAVRQEKENNEFGRHFQRLYERTIEYMKKTYDTIGRTADAGR
jgi:hypothetical protein